jgi:hypothetical protein
MRLSEARRIVARRKNWLPRPWTWSKLKKAMKGKRRKLIELDSDTQYGKGPYPILVATSYDMTDDDVERWAERETLTQTNGVQDVEFDEDANWVVWSITWAYWAHQDDIAVGMG